MKNVSFRERFQYWLDKRMAKGSLGIIKLLLPATLLLVLVIALLVSALDLNPEQGFLENLWESFATIINAWMPSIGDGPLGYVILLALAAVGGLFVASMLISVVSSAIEEKFSEIRKGRSRILESGHTVILGFRPGDYTLIEQLILASAGRPATIVVAGDTDSVEMEHSIEDAVEIPKNVTLICRQADIFDGVALEKLMLSRSRSVIVSPMDDRSTVKALLAAGNLIDENGVDSPRMSAIMSGNEYRMPVSISERHNITMLQTNNVLAKIIAHSCTQSGLSKVFQEVFNFDNSEFYVVELPDTEGLRFIDLLGNMVDGVPAGIMKGGKILLNPPAGTVMEKGDSVLVFAEERHLPLMRSPAIRAAGPLEAEPLLPEVTEKQVTVIGFNKCLFTVIKELPEDVTRITLAGLSEEEATRISAARFKRENLTISFHPDRLNDEEDYAALMKDSRHVVILSDHRKNDDDADMEAIFHILYLRDVRQRYGLDFNITAEMRLKQNEDLVSNGDNTDYIVSSNMSSLFLAQLSESPELISVFMEVLTNRGNEFYIRTAAELGCAGGHTVEDLRLRLCRRGSVFLGVQEERDGRYVHRFNLPLDEQLYLEPEDRLVILSEK